jgi:hypothetical protein
MHLDPIAPSILRSGISLNSERIFATFNPLVYFIHELDPILNQPVMVRDSENNVLPFWCSRLGVVSKIHSLLPTPAANVQIRHNVTFLEVCEEVVDGRLRMVSSTFPPKSLMHSAQWILTTPTPLTSRNFKYQTWSSREIRANSFFSFCSSCWYLSITSLETRVLLNTFSIPSFKISLH